MPVQMELSRIIISEINDQQVIYLKEVEGDRTFPILIGLFEATSIDRRVKHIQAPRPLTHDLLVNMVEQLGDKLTLNVPWQPAYTMVPVTTMAWSVSGWAALASPGVGLSPDASAVPPSASDVPAGVRACWAKAGEIGNSAAASAA